MTVFKKISYEKPLSLRKVFSQFSKKFQKFFFDLDFHIKKDTPQSVIEELNQMTDSVCCWKNLEHFSIDII